MMSTLPARPIRCTLAVPGSSEKMMAKAAALSVDQVFLDLEDAVAFGAKESARRLAIKALTGFSWQARTLSVRINDVGTPWCHDDIIQLVSHAGAQISTLVLAKTNQAADVHFVHLLLDQLEQKLGLQNRIGIEGLIEDVSGLLHISEISHEHIETPHSVLNVNDQMKVMIIDLDAERGRISLSTKALEPEPGDMLTDPQKVFEKAEEMAARYKQMLLEQAEEGEDPISSMMI